MRLYHDNEHVVDTFFQTELNDFLENLKNQTRRIFAVVDTQKNIVSGLEQ